MKKEIKVGIQKLISWMCIAIGLVGTLALVVYGASYFIGELDFDDAAFLMFFPFLLCTLAMWGSREKVSATIELNVGQSNGRFLLFGAKLLFLVMGFAIISIVAFALVAAVISVVCWAILSLADFLVSWLIQQEILSATHGSAIAIVLAICMGGVIFYVFSRIFLD